MVRIGGGDRDAPTMIIPGGTDIQVDVHGQLSIRTPGNLVIQNSGHYATLESMNGSIRIEPDAEVEAVNVRCAETCFVEGSLTAWRVIADKIHLEDSARANIVLREARRLEVGSEARLVGNFSSEKELFVLLSRFANELRALPLFAERRRASEELSAEASEQLLSQSEAGSGEREVVEAEVEPPVVPTDPASGGLADPLFYSLVILEREFNRPVYGPTSRRMIEELVKLLQDRDIDTLRLTYRTLFGRIVEPGKDIQRVYDLVDGHFRQATQAGEA